jgi:hypothetical protein
LSCEQLFLLRLATIVSHQRITAARLSATGPGTDGFDASAVKKLVG